MGEGADRTEKVPKTKTYTATATTFYFKIMISKFLFLDSD